MMRQRLVEALCRELTPEMYQAVAINRLLGCVESPVVSIGASSAFHAEHPDVIKAVHEIVANTGIRVCHGVNTRPDLPEIVYYAPRDLFSQASQALVVANVVYSAVAIQCEVTNLAGEPAWYAAAHSCHDDLLQRFECTMRNLHNRILGMEYYYASGMKFVPKAA
ncbi:MAG: hypothetical protein WC080_00630 [Patescibacteria group bacterium]|jgi:hypothetical protein